MGAGAGVVRAGTGAGAGAGAGIVGAGTRVGVGVAVTGTGVGAGVAFVGAVGALFAELFVVVGAGLRFENKLAAGRVAADALGLEVCRCACVTGTRALATGTRAVVLVACVGLGILVAGT